MGCNRLEWNHYTTLRSRHLLPNAKGDQSIEQRERLRPILDGQGTMVQYERVTTCVFLFSFTTPTAVMGTGFICFAGLRG